MSTSLTSIRFGETISGAPSRNYKHPWFTTPVWLPAAQRWGATVEPGFVNATGNPGKTPVYRATVKEQQAVGNPWEINPLTGKKFFSAPVFAQQSTEVGSEIVDIPLYLSPAIPLDFRAVGFDGDPDAAVPSYFLNLSVAKAPVQPSLEDQLNALDSGGAPATDPVPPVNLRLLRACDLWVHQPRVGLTSSVTLEPGIATGSSNVTQTLGVAFPPPSDTLRVLQGTFVPFTPGAGIDPTQSDYTEPTWDEILISAVYLLSPPNTPLGSEPDATWQPFVRHNLFWNLNWAQPEFQPSSAAVSGAPFIPPLAAGAAQLLINFETASLNDATQNALNIILGSSLAGSFWTPTGGGSSAQFSVDSIPPKTGPDRTANAQAKLAAQQQQTRTAQLDPDFPYTAQPFSTSFLATA